jgi:pimeloyl-ACP methyl ester carboxylesterase
MKQSIINIPPKNIRSIHINGMRGRLLYLKSNKAKDKQILLVYGHHSSIERMYSLASHLTEYGNVTMPDLPGFGGMDSFYIIGRKPTIDNMADYLASFIKLHYKKQKFAVCGMSYGFLVVTRMLQKYPELSDRVQIMVSLVGFSDKSDFGMSIPLYKSLRIIGLALSFKPLAIFAQYVLFSKPMLYMAYKVSASSHPKMKGSSEQEFKRRVGFEYYLWRCNDARTYAYSLREMLGIELTKFTKINLKLHHVMVSSDQYFNNDTVMLNLNRIYTKVTPYIAKLPNHAPTVIASPVEAGLIIPKKLQIKLRGKTIWR